MSGFHVFTLAGIPVFIGPWYLLLVGFWALGGDLRSGLIWSAVVTVSILVHEFGHGFVAKSFGLEPRIMLHGLGGLTAHQPARRDRDDALVTAAGPIAGLLLGALTWLYAASDFRLSSPGEGAIVESSIIASLLQVNIFWSLVNLLPMHPLDGGKLFRLGLGKLTRPVTADKLTFGTGIAMSVGWIAVSHFYMHSTFMVILGIWILIDNVRGWQGGVTTARAPENRYASELHKRAIVAFGDEKFDEAARLGQRIRAESNVAEKVLRDTWRILGVSYARLGRFEEALSYLGRALPKSEVVEAKIECLHQLGQAQELARVIESDDFQRLAEPRRLEILEVLGRPKPA